MTYTISLDDKAIAMVVRSLFQRGLALEQANCTSPAATEHFELANGMSSVAHRQATEAPLVLPDTYPNTEF